MPFPYLNIFTATRAMNYSPLHAQKHAHLSNDFIFSEIKLAPATPTFDIAVCCFLCSQIEIPSVAIPVNLHHLSLLRDCNNHPALSRRLAIRVSTLTLLRAFGKSHL
jgi:hypothetical protein